MMIKNILSITLAFCFATALYGAESKPKKQTKTSAKSSKEQMKNTTKIDNNEFEVGQSSEMPPIPKPPIPPLVRDEAKETVYDPTTKLMWQDNSEVKNNARNWQDAMSYCDNLTFAGYSDWRLPEIKELLNINDKIEDFKSGFQNVYFLSSWSSSTSARNYNSAWGDFGSDGTRSKDESALVRCVRDSENR